MPSFEVREARSEDMESIVRVLWKAFDQTMPFEDFQKEDWLNRWNNQKEEDWAYVAIEGGKAQANLCFFAHEDNVIRGKPQRFGGVWAVATAPNQRRQGMIRELFRDAFPKMRKERMYLSILDPFYVPFYEQFGYALAETFAGHEFTPDIMKKVERPNDITSREILETSEWEKVAKVQRTLKRFGSRVFHTKHAIEGNIKRNHLYLLERGNDPVGVVKFHFDRKPEGLDLQVWMITSFTSLDVFPAIMNLIANYSVNVKKVTWWCDEAYPVKHFIRSTHKLETKKLGSKMMRIVDLEKYLPRIQIPETATESVVLNLEDELCPWNTGTFELTPSNGALACDPIDKAPDLDLDALGLSKIISGLTPATMLHSLGEIQCTTETAKNLERIFPHDSFMAYMRY